MSASDRLPCRKCNTSILPLTAERNGGLCRPCFENLDAVKDLRRQNNAEVEHVRAAHEKPFPPAGEKARLTSIIELIAWPKEFDKQRVQIIGCAGIEIENTALYLSRDDARYHITKNSVALAVPDQAWRERDKYHLKFTAAAGTFHAAPVEAGSAIIRCGVLRDIVHFHAHEFFLDSVLSRPPAS